MIFALGGLLAQSTAALEAASSRTAYRFAMLESLLDERWQLGLLLAIAAALLAYVAWLYRRDTHELRPGARWLLLTLRIAALAAVLFYFLNLERRSEKQVVHHSRVLLLVDTSESMLETDNLPGESGAGGSRIDRVVQELSDGTLVPELRDVHDVTVVRFDRDVQRIATLRKTSGADRQAVASEQSPAAREAARRETGWLLLTAGGIFVAAIVSIGLYFISRSRLPTTASWLLYPGVVALLAGAVTVAIAQLRHPEVDLLAALGLREPQPADAALIPAEADTGEPAETDEDAAAEEQAAEEQIDWPTALAATGGETRLGSAIKRLIDEERSTPVSAIVVVSDGSQNAGLEPASVAPLARKTKIPVFTIGIGSDRKRPSIRIVDFTAPTRAYPEDEFSVTGFVQAENYSRTRAIVELYARDAAAAEPPGARVAAKEVDLPADGQLVPVKFDLESKETGRRTYRLQLSDIAADHDPEDNYREADVEVLDRKTRVLLMADAASREYRFLRNQLRRDKQVIVDVWLQSALGGISQDANEILDDFPTTKAELYEYDCIVAFDPDWTMLDSLQIDLLESWVAEQAGGLVVAAGPIHTAGLTADAGLAPLRHLYPVILYRRESPLTIGGYEAERAWPLEFSDAGRDAEFLWLEDSATASEGTWTEFGGVYEFFDVKGAKPGATVYARFSNPEATLTGELPVYLAGHIYGSGRVFYMGSSEFYRLRALGEGYFERLYVKLIRHVSQGRLLRGSQRGLLLVEHDRYRPGDTVVVRAQLSDLQHEPLELPSVNLQVTQPDETTKTVVLKADASRKGMYEGQFTVLQQRAYRLDLALPDSSDQQLTKRIMVQGSNPEKVNPERNDPLLSSLASSTGGRFYIGLDAAKGRAGVPPLPGQLRNRTETTTLSGAPDKAFRVLLMQWLLGLIVGTLATEWLLRRLFKLA